MIRIGISMAAMVLATSARDDDFERKAARLFRKDYSYHAWRQGENTVEGNDWSLPPWVKASFYSGISIDPNKVPDEFPGRLQRTVRVSWREIEPTENAPDFSSLRERILKASEGGTRAVRMGLAASVWETRYFRSLDDKTTVRTTPGTAPVWMLDYGVKRIEERPNRSIPFQVVNLDIYDPEYHRRYVRLVRELGESGVPRMKELDVCYLHLRSASRGEEGSGPEAGDPDRRFYEERLSAWAEAFAGVEYKLCNVSHQEADMEVALELGMPPRTLKGPRSHRGATPRPVSPDSGCMRESWC